ncbi:hypothetical protein EDB81DRAFT_855037 [Dactylonectria macrodidyma]|uniref:Myb-like domain-containing protein n=1 Tax=Dactylonectria macrodidyma TaxID=307937 RepID=A0A9P9F982_9HYPO|nr:hypothetical protein EDB81DRAFT_855037 [Dactylonectria macrodidyma]
MPAKKAASTATAEGETPLGLTDGELRFIKAIFDNMTQKPDANWDAVAQNLSLKDAKCAKERFRQMSVRHGWREQGAVGSSPRKPKAAAGASASGSDAKVTKKPRTPRKKAIKKDEDTESDVKEDPEVKKEVKTEDNDVTMDESEEP